MGVTTCLPHRDGEIPLSAFLRIPQINLLAFLHTILFVLSSEAVNNVCQSLLRYDSKRKCTQVNQVRRVFSDPGFLKLFKS